MMTDIVDWLKDEAKKCLQVNIFGDVARPEQTRYWEAVEEIERMRDALKSIASITCCDQCQEAALVARAALDTQGTKP